MTIVEQGARIDCVGDGVVAPIEPAKVRRENQRQHRCYFITRYRTVQHSLTFADLNQHNMWVYLALPLEKTKLMPTTTALNVG